MFGLWITTTNGEHSDVRDYDTLDEAVKAATQVLGRPEHGGMVTALAVQVYEHPRPRLRLVASKQGDSIHLMSVDAGESRSDQKP
jgi:hypothetical protein